LAVKSGRLAVDDLFVSRLRDLALPSLAAAVCALGLGAMGMLTPAFTDYETEVEPALNALRSGDVSGFLALAPAYGGSLAIRAPFAFLPDLWGGGDLALFRSMAVPALLAGAILGVFLWSRAHTLGRPAVACWIALLLVAGNPLTLRALEIGHPEELLGAVLCVAAALVARTRHHVLAGVLLGLAIANKPWAVLAVLPIAWIAVGGRLRLLFAAGATAAAVLLPLVAGGGVTDQATAVASNSGTIFQPWQLWWFFGDTGHVVMGSFGVKPDYRMPPGWLPGAMHPLLVLVVGATSLAMLLRMRGRAWHEGLLLLAFALLLRCVLDPWNVSYYCVPFLIALVAWEVHAHRFPVVAMAATLLSWVTLVSLPLEVGPDAQALAYLAWTLPLTALLAVRLWSPQILSRQYHRLRGDPPGHPAVRGRARGGGDRQLDRAPA
jgi:hypothetical protein